MTSIVTPVWRIGAAITLGLIASLASAQTVGIGTTKSGATGQAASGVANIVSANSPVRMRPQPVEDTSKYLTDMDHGGLEFGVANHSQLASAARGVGLSEGKPHPNLRMVATLVPVWTGFYVRDASGIKTVAELRGKRIAGGFPAAPLPKFVTAGFLATAGLTYADVINVPMANFDAHWSAFEDGKTDAFVGALGSAVINRIEAATGRLRLLSFDKTPAAVTGLQSGVPAAEIVTLPQNPKLIGLAQGPVNVMQLHYTVSANKDVSPDIVYQVTKAIYENDGKLVELAPMWSEFNRGLMTRDVGVEYHPGAVRLYREKGAWKR